MNKTNTFYLLVGVVILAIVGLGIYKLTKPEELVSEKALELEITTYSVEGEIISYADGKALVTTSRVERTPDGNKVVTFEKEITLAENVTFSRVFRADIEKALIRQTDLAKYLKPGAVAVFYGSGIANPKGGDVFTADRVELIKPSAN